ncbi:MAG: Uncharacterized protein CEN92_237 [Candidatus Berkelbacteria bacterium Licking1014_96]|uniref:Uncharacterized protein n=1 Tax=Candidatus Berkelbacteria bacterium Licking1014_96 TaxID=2017149 RepID=A0A554LFR2_9BACT|nr:MAG: Uncharacterized protein CEN92_237 [Candidatus Berkelbacteria bacterium Licking1014_96]
MILGLFKKRKPEEKAKEINIFAATSAFKIFRDKKFRGLLNFDQQSQTEQDRFFNELVVSTLILSIYIVRDYSIGRDDDQGEYWHEVKSNLESQFIVYLDEIGIPRKFVDVWSKLINLRKTEYDRDKIEMRSQMMASKEFQSQVENIRLIRTQVLAIGCLCHLRRGKKKPKDPLYLFLLRWIMKLNKKIEWICR